MSKAAGAESDRDRPLDAVRHRLHGILVFLGAIWAVFLLGRFFSTFDANRLGLVPRSLGGLLGILTMPFVHANWSHIAANTVPLVVLLTLLVASKAKPWGTLAGLSVASGVLLWLLGRPGQHVGASALIYTLVTFLIVTGLLEKSLPALVVSFVVGFLYGGTLIWGVIPGLRAGVSWDGHLYGAIAGVVVAYALRFDPRQRRPELPEP